MTEINHPAYYGVLTANVRYNEQLSMSEKIMFSEITALSNAHGFCSARNKYFANLYGKSEKTISIWIKHLKDYGFIQIEYERRGAEVISRKIYPIPEHELQKCNSTDNKNVTRTNYKNVKENNTSINNINKNMLGCYAIEFYEKNIGFISPFIREDIEAEVRDWNQINPDESEQIIVEALKNAIGAQASNKWKYAKSILSSWQEKNIKSIDDIKADDVEHRKKMESKYNRKNNNYGRKPIEEKMPYWYQHENKEINTNDSHENIDHAEIEKLMQKINDEEE